MFIFADKYDSPKPEYMFLYAQQPGLKTLTLLFLIIGLASTSCSTSRTHGMRAKSPSSSSARSREYQLRKDIVQYASKYKGTKYKYAGKTPNTGFDCSGFTSYVMDAYDISLSPSSKLQSKQGARKPVNQAQPGDLVFFRRSGVSDVFHVALVVDASPGSLVVIHSTTSRGVIIEDLMKSTYWKPKISEVRDVIR